jgi:hypothetical protein
MEAVYLHGSDPKEKNNVYVMLGSQCVASLKKKGIDSPKTYFRGKTIHATGQLEMAAGQPFITIINATKLVEVKHE